MLRSTTSAFTRVFDELVAAWCAADPGSIGCFMGPGSAAQRKDALRRVRDMGYV
jgi:hypothetical protein